MEAQLKTIGIYPVKGLGGMTLLSAEIRAEAGIPGDRAFAFHFLDRLEAGEPLVDMAWRRKQNFAVQADWPVLAAVQTRYDAASSTLSLTYQGRTVVEDVRYDQGREALAEFLLEVLRSAKASPKAVHPQASALRLAGNPAGGTRFPDRGASHVSILNLASLRELSKALGSHADVDVRRFRGNLIVDGWQPWAELGLVGQTVRIGGAAILVKGTIGRCHNINVDQDSGDDKVPVLKTLEAAFGHTKFGVVGVVSTAATVAVGDPVSVLAPL